MWVVGGMGWGEVTTSLPLPRASMIWIIGEYAERIDNAGELLGTFLENFVDETTSVQLQLLTAIVKLFLKRPAETQELVQSVLSLATQVCGCVGVWGVCVTPPLCPYRTVTTLTCETEATSTGGCCPQTRPLPRKWCWQRSHSSLRRQIGWNPTCWMVGCHGDVASP